MEEFQPIAKFLYPLLFLNSRISFEMGVVNPVDYQKNNFLETKTYSVQKFTFMKFLNSVNIKARETAKSDHNTYLF